MNNQLIGKIYINPYDNMQRIVFAGKYSDWSDFFEVDKDMWAVLEREECRTDDEEWWDYLIQEATQSYGRPVEFDKYGLGARDNEDETSTPTLMIFFKNA